MARLARKKAEQTLPEPKANPKGTNNEANARSDQGQMKRRTDADNRLNLLF
jgi:hypothetical protein